MASQQDSSALPAGCAGCAGSADAAAATSATAARGLPVVDRREFLSRSALAALGLALAACGGSSDGPTSPTTVSATTLTLSSFPALGTVGGVAYVNAGSTPVAVVRTSSTAFVAFSRICPHQGGTVNAQNGEFDCPVHGARFNLTTGAWIGGERTSSLRQYSAVYDATAGTVTVGG